MQLYWWPFLYTVFVSRLCKRKKIEREVVSLMQSLFEAVEAARLREAEAKWRFTWGHINCHVPQQFMA